MRDLRYLIGTDRQTDSSRCTHREKFMNFRVTIPLNMMVIRHMTSTRTTETVKAEATSSTAVMEFQNQMTGK